MKFYDTKSLKTIEQKRKKNQYYVLYEIHLQNFPYVFIDIRCSSQFTITICNLKNITSQKDQLLWCTYF